MAVSIVPPGFTDISGAFESPGGKPELKLYAYIAGYGLIIDARELTQCPDDLEPEDFTRWPGTWFRCTVSGPGSPRPSVSFSYGQAPADGKRPPSPTEALNAVAGIARDIDGTSGFEDWCADWGANPDSLKAMKQYQRECRIAERLKAACGSTAAYSILLYNTETL